MNDLNTLLDRAAGPAATPVDAEADLRRGHRALSRTRRRRGAAGLLGLAAAGVVGVGVVRHSPPDDARVLDRSSHQQKGAGVSLLSQPFVAGPYTFDSTPQGWEVQGVNPTAVTIAPVGFPDQDPSSFTGKLVILFDGNPADSGQKVDVDGRSFWVGSDSDYTTISTRTQVGEPDGVVRIQYPDDTGWTRETMLAFLASVHVGAGAQQGVG
jgi:hypothetical protein